MQHFDAQTSNDLEFDQIRLRLAGYCHCETAEAGAKALQPYSQQDDAIEALHKAKEFLRIRTEGETFPHLDFDELHKELRLLRVKDAVLPEDAFLKIARDAALVNELHIFFDKRHEEFPTLVTALDGTWFTREVETLINKVFDKRGKVKDDASETLYRIRQQKAELIKRINRMVDAEIAKLQRKGMLSDTREAYLNNRRVLSVVATYKRQVPGVMHGASRTGQLTYIEPRNVVPLNNELEETLEEERQEIYRILRELTRALAQHIDLIEGYHNVLVAFDFIQAKVRLALELKADLPGLVTDEVRFELIDAYHPILLLANVAHGKKTLPQTLSMDKFSRMLVISGPNAGGKSITLKTVGLLQIMLQSGLLVPVNPNSKMCFFQTVLTDIGDNQSIENQLSTYSYRLRRMKHFLEVANRRSLLLLDEFGTGSDPDLGGALAEVFFESLYNKRCFGVITTHYSNIKLKAARLRNAVNACMLFDRETLEPTFKLSLGQPGSSFTFEVAQSNGIPLELIEEAKAKTDNRKVEMDKLLTELQNEKTQLEKLNESSRKAESRAEAAREDFEEKKERFEERLKNQQELIEQNNTFLHRGKKLSRFIERYELPKGKKKNLNNPLLTEVKEFLAREKTKQVQAVEAEKEAERVRAAQRKARKPKPFKRGPEREKIKKGSMVRLEATRQTGTVEKIDGDEVTVVFDFMTMKVGLDKLAYVNEKEERAKKK